MIVCDIDGTLVREDGSINRLLSAMLRFVGDDVVFLTGRIAGRANTPATKSILRTAGFGGCALRMRPVTRAQEHPSVWKCERLSVMEGVDLVIDDDMSVLECALGIGAKAIHPVVGFVRLAEQ